MTGEGDEGDIGAGGGVEEECDVVGASGGGGDISGVGEGEGDFSFAVEPATMVEGRLVEREGVTEALPAVAVMVMGTPRMLRAMVLLIWAGEPLGEESLTTTMMW